MCHFAYDYGKDPNFNRNTPRPSHTYNIKYLCMHYKSNVPHEVKHQRALAHNLTIIHKFISNIQSLPNGHILLLTRTLFFWHI